MTQQNYNKESSAKGGGNGRNGPQPMQPAAVWIAALQSSLARLIAAGVVVRTETNSAGDLCIVLPGYTLKRDESGRATITAQGASHADE